MIDDGEGAEVVRRVGDDVAVGGDDVEPLGEEKVDLLDVLLERGVAGGVVVDVVGGAQTFTGVHGDVGGLERGLAMGRDGGLLAGFQRGLSGGGEGAVVAGLGAKTQLGQGLNAQEAHDEDEAEEKAEEGKDIEDAAQALPAFSLGIVEDRFVH